MLKPSRFSLAASTSAAERVGGAGVSHTGVGSSPGNTGVAVFGAEDGLIDAATHAPRLSANNKLAANQPTSARTEDTTF
jgi:hypothetical protein